MGNSFRLDDLLGSDTTEKKPPRKKGETQDAGFSLDDLLGPDTSTAPAPSSGNVDLRDPPVPAPAATVAPRPAPAPRRGIADRIGDTLGQANEFMSRDRDAEVRRAVGVAPRETRRPAVVPDRETAAEKLARIRANIGDTIQQRPDQARVSERGSIQEVTEQTAVRAGNEAEAARKQRFSPKKWRDIARRGMELANTLHAEGKHDEAEDTSKKAYNAQLLADGADDADTFGAIALSAMLGIVSDPFEGQRRNMAEIRRTPGATFDTEREQQELGISEQVPTDRGFEPGKDIGAYALGSLPTMALGGAAGRVGIGLAGRALAQRGMTRAANIAQALSAEIETVGIYGPKQAGAAGVREAVGNLRQNVGRLASRGAVEGQAVGMAQAARAAQDTGDDPLEAAILEGVFGAGLGSVGEVLGGALTRLGGVAGRTSRRTIGEALNAFDGSGRFIGNIDGPKTIELDVDPAIKDAAETARDVEGKTAIGDMTPEGQHRTLVEALSAVLDQKAGAENFGSDTGMILRDPLALTARTSTSPEPDVPLRTARDIALAEQGIEPVPAPRDNANAVVQMFRAADERRAIDEQVRAEAEASRLEVAATKRAAEKQGPLPLATTIARAGKEAEADVPLAAEYKQAIDKFADVGARMRDAAGAPNEKLKLDYAKARTALNNARRKYGVETGAAAVAALASADEDLTDEERQMIGVGALAFGAQRVIPAPKGLPPDVRARARKLFDQLRAEQATGGNQLTVQRNHNSWMELLESAGAGTGRHFDAVSQKLWIASGHDPYKVIPAEEVEAIFEAGDEYTGLSRGFRSRLRDAVETLPGKAWDSPRAAGDWIGKLKGASTFSKAELNLILPTLDNAVASKAKLTRADVLGMLDEKLPQIDRLTFADQPAAARRGTLGGRTFDDPDEVIVDDDEISEAWGADALREQIDAREQKLASIKDHITETQDRYDRDKDYAESEMSEAAETLRETLGKFDDIDASEWKDKITQMLSEKIEGDFIPRGLVDEVWDEWRQSGEINYESELRDIDDLGFESEEIPNPVDDGPDAEPWARVTAPDGETYDAPTTWEAMAFLDREHGIVNHGGRDPLLDDGVRFEKVPPRTQWNVINIEDGKIWDQRRIPGHLYNTTDEAYEFQLKQSWGEQYRVERLPAGEARWTMTLANGRVYDQASTGESRDDFVTRVVHERWSSKVDEDDIDEVRNDIDRLANRMAAYSEAESMHYHYTENESEAFSDEYETMESLREGIRAITELHNTAGTRPVVAEPTDDAIPIRSIGDTHYKTYQRIPGGTEYRELVNSWSNPPGGDIIPRKAYGISAGHDYWTDKGAPSSVGHMRAEVHTIRQTPGLAGEKVTIPDDIVGNPQIKQQYDFIAENRRARVKLLDQMQQIADEYERLPATETNPQSPSQRAMDMARKYDDLNNQVVTIGKQEDTYVENIHRLRGQLLGLNEPKAERVLNFLESQTSLSQFQVTLADIALDEVGTLKRRAAEAKAAQTVAYQAEQAAHDKLYSAENAFHNVEINNGMGFDFYAQLRSDLRSRGFEEAASNTEYGLTVADMDVPMNKPIWDYITERHPDVIPMARAWKEALDWRTAVSDARVKAEAAYQKLYDQAQNASGKVDVGMFNEIENAQAFNAARAWIEFGEGDHDALMFSDAPNRIKNAHLQRKAARRWYDELWPAAHKRIMRFMGLKEGTDFTFEHVFVKGEGHWKITPRDPAKLRKLIRDRGVYPLALVAMMSQSAEAQDGAEQESPYGSLVGGIAAGGLLVALAGNRKLRRLLAENAELRTALMRDDMSGLANKTAHARAVGSVDRDANMAWLAFDGDQFKALNDAHGHPEGDKAITHFGQAIRDAAAQAGVPMRGFRAGGDEFAMAVPKERAAEVLRLVEDASPYTKGGVTTKLSGSIGDTWAVADALLTATKAERRAADPNVARVHVRPDMQKALTEEITKALDTSLKLYSNPIGPALRELRKYPSAAAVGLVGYAMATESENDNIQRAGMPVMALAALSAIGSRRLIAGKDALASRLVNQLRKTPEGTNTVRFFNPDSLLDPAVREAILQYERDAAKGKARAVEFSGKSKNLGGAGDRAVSDVLDNEQWEDMAAMTAEQTTDILTVAAELAAEYDRLTKAQVNAGVLDQSQVLPDYGGPRRYAYFEALDALADSPSNLGKPGRRPRIAGVKQRTLDVPLRAAEDALKEARAAGDPKAIDAAMDALDEAKVVQLSQRVQLGEIREASYRAAQGIERAHNSVASAQLFHSIRNVPGSAHPEWEQAVDDLLAAKQMYKTATNKVDKDAAELMQNSAAVTLDEITKKYRGRDGEYVSLPDSPSLGVLRGAVVKRDIAHSLEGFGTPGLYGKTIRAWKEIKTVFNIGTSIGNILSNITALHVGDVPMWLQPYYLTEGVKDLRNYGEGTRALAEAGVLNVNAVNALGTGELGSDMRKEEGLEELLGTTRPETQQVLRQQGITEERMAGKFRRRAIKGMAVGGTIGAMKTYDDENPENAVTGAAIGAGLGAVFGGKHANWVRRVYDNEDNIARLAVFHRRRKLGDTIEQATQRSIESLGNFRSRSPALKMIASTVSPFVLYQAKAVPAFAMNVVDNPWKYLSLIAAWGAMNEMAQEEMGEIPESDIPVNQRRRLGYFFPGFTQLPFGDERGNKAAIDAARWTPISGLTTGAPPGSIPEAFSDQGMALVTPGGPVIDAALRGSNIDPYKKEPLIQRDRPTGENVETLANAAADFVLPSMLGIHAKRLKEDIDNGDWTKFKNDLFGPTGAKPRYIRPGAVATDATYTLRRSLADMKQELRKELRANKDPERVKLLADRYNRRVATALANFKERIGTPPDREIVDEFLQEKP